MEARLALFMDVCSAIQHAHQKGIIHRDLHEDTIASLEEALRVNPNNYLALSRISELYMNTERGDPATNWLVRNTMPGEHWLKWIPVIPMISLFVPACWRSWENQKRP